MKLFRCVPFSIELAEGAAPKRVQLFKVGTVHHPKYGTFDITPQILLSMKQNFDNKVRGIDIALDYAHESDKIAAGWLSELVLEENNTQLWGVVDWTKSGADVVLGKEYRYISPDFTFDYQDNETLKKYGPTLLGAGLTNRPVLKGMAPVELSEGGNNQMDEKDKEIAALKAQMEEMKKAHEAKDMEMSELKKKIEEKELAEKTAAEKAAADAAAAEKEKALAEKKGKFDVMLSEGKCVEAQREAFMTGDFEAFTKNARVLNLSEKGHGGENKPGSGSASEQLLKLAEERAEKDNIGLAEAVSVVKAENPELEKQYRLEVTI